MVGQVLDLVSPQWAYVSVLTPHLASGIRVPMARCTPKELICTPRFPELSLAVWTAPEALDVTAANPGPKAMLGGFLPDDGPTPPVTGLAASSYTEVLEKVADNDFVQTYLVLQLQAAAPMDGSRGVDAQLCRVIEDHRQMC